MLDAEYSAAWLKQNNYKVKKLTRRENGEGEIRFSEWQNALILNNFYNPLLVEYIYRSKRSIKVWIISNLPRFIAKKFFSFWIKPTRWGIKLIPTLLLGIPLKLSLKKSELWIQKFPTNVKTTLVRKQVILARAK